MSLLSLANMLTICLLHILPVSASCCGKANPVWVTVNPEKSCCREVQ